MESRPPVTFACSRCGAVFSDSESLKAHALGHDFLAHGHRVARNQPGDLCFACSRCGASFASGDQLRRHAKLRCGQTCELSGEAFAGWRAHRVPAAPSLEYRVPAAARTRRRPVIARAAGVIAAAMVVFLFVALGANAWWATEPAASPVRISTGSWGSFLTMSPGSSRTMHTSGACSRYLPIASIDTQGLLSLDFGDVSPSYCTSWGDVIRVASQSPTQLQVSLSIRGEISPFFQGVGFANDTTAGRILPSETRSVAMRLVVPKKTAAGTYDGTLIVAVLGSSETHAIPMTVTIRGKRPSHPPRPTHRPRPTWSTHPSPSPHPTCSPSPSCSPSNAPSPSCPPSPAPSEDWCTIAPGLSTQLPQLCGQTAPPSVAWVLPDGAVAVDFGPVPRGQKVHFRDVLRLTSTAATSARVTLMLSGSATQDGERVGFWDDVRGVVSSGLTLEPGQTSQVAFEFDLGSGVPCGSQMRALAIEVRVDEREPLQWTLPLALTAVWSGASPGPSWEPSAKPSRSPKPRSSHTPRTRPAPTPTS